MSDGKKTKKAARKEHDLLAPVTALADTRAVKSLSPVAKLTDEPPLLALGIGTLALGLTLRRPAIVRSGVRMVASHLLATGVKTVLKASVDRTRPNAAGNDPSIGKGHGAQDSDRNAFPSGHTAGAVAVAQAVAREMPGAAVLVRIAAGAAGALQVPRGAHYVTDVLAGAAIGWLSERVASWALDATARFAAARAVTPEAEAEAHPS